MRHRTALALAAVCLIGLLASPGASKQEPDDMFVPGTFYPNCGGMSPALEFTHEDFQKGFSRTYTFPGTMRCELGQLGDRGGSVKLSYTPGKNASLQADLNYWEVNDCSDDEPRSVRYEWRWSGELHPTDSDPDGVFPAASFGRMFLSPPPRVSVQGNCGEPGRPPELRSFRIGLVSKHPETAQVRRTAYVLLRGNGLAAMGEIAFAGGRSESDVEVAVEPSDDYRTWMPAGNLRYPLNPGAELPPGEELRINVKVHQKGDRESRGKAKLRFGFRDVSREKGVCLNWPPDGADTKPDLRLRFADTTLGEPSADGTSIETDGLVEEVTLIVDAYDFGAWGTLRISATDKDKRDVVVKVQGRQTPDLAIPLDEDANHIADGWNPGAAKDKPGDADDEHQEGNDHDGDGLTLYEEYRGFVEDRSHRQGDPAKKDFFVLNRVGKTAEPGINAFARASQLHVHAQLADEEMDWDSGRVINKYSSSGFEQHGVVLTLHATPDDDKGHSEAVGGPGPPATVEKILISAKNRARPVAVPGTKFTDADLEVAHELMHAVNVWHHGEGDWEPIKWTTGKVGEMLEIRDDGRSFVRAFLDSENGAEVTADRIAGRPVWLGRQGGQHSGAQCLMRYTYNGILAYQDRTAPNSRRLVYDGPREFGVELCRSPRGTGVNDKDRSPQPAWGDAAEGRGNCFGQITVSDRYLGR